MLKGGNINFSRGKWETICIYARTSVITQNWGGYAHHNCPNVHFPLCTYDIEFLHHILHRKVLLEMYFADKSIYGMSSFSVTWIKRLRNTMHKEFDNMSTCHLSLIYLYTIDTLGNHHHSQSHLVSHPVRQKLWHEIKSWYWVYETNATSQSVIFCLPKYKKGRRGNTIISCCRKS